MTLEQSIEINEELSKLLNKISEIGYDFYNPGQEEFHNMIMHLSNACRYATNFSVILLEEKYNKKSHY